MMWIRCLRPCATLPLLLLLWAACGPAERSPREIRFDLAQRLSLARVTREPAEIRFGSPAAAPYLLGGWVRSGRRDARDLPFIWSRGEASAIRLPLLKARDLELVFRCRPYRAPGAEQQVLTVEVNDRVAGELRLGWGVREVSLQVPASFWRPGENRVVFRYSYAVSLGENTGRREPPQVAVAWYDLQLRNGFRSDGADPHADPDTGRLVIPSGVRLDYDLEVPGDSVFEIVDVEWPETVQPAAAAAGESGPALEVTLTTDDETEWIVAVLTPDSTVSEMPLTGEGGQIVRLGLRLIGSAGPDGAGAVTLIQPRILAAPQPSPPPVAIAATVARPDPPPNIVIYLIDTLRADHLGCYGHDRPVSPNIDAFAAESTLFENAVAQSSWTKASVASILTGLWPPAHGANRRGDKLSDAALTLGEMLQKAGYRTAGVGTNPNVSGPFGFRQGFDDFVLLRRRNSAAAVNEVAFEWLSRHAAEAPFFLYLHTVEPHDPYTPPVAFRERFAPQVSPAFAASSKQVLKDLRRGRREAEPQVIENLLALYDAEIATNDADFGRLIERLREMDLYDNTLIILVSDHGEEFYEHGGWTHGRTLQAESVNVPLIVHWPGQREGRRVATPAQHIDIVPTLLEALGLPPQPGLEGRSLRLVAAADRDGEPGERRIFSYLDLDQVTQRARSPVRNLVGVVENEWKLVHDLRSRSPMPDLTLYRWRRDIGEENDLSLEFPVRAGFLDTLTAERLLAPEERLVSDEAIIDAELEESLRALGYLP